jgi:FtsH-binding integral membrane protein
LPHIETEALRLYLDFINLFVMLMQLLGTRRN